MKGVTNLVYALLTVPLVLIIAIAIFGQFEANIDRSSWTASANSSFEKVTSQTWSGYNLAALLPFVLISVVIASAIVGLAVLRMK